MPNTVKQAIIALWVTLAISAIIAVIDKRLGTVSDGMFCGFLFIYGVSCIFPYKLSRGSNPTRYIFAILTVIGYLTMIGGVTNGMPKLDIITTFLLIPVNAFIIWRLFTGKANDWFANKNPPALPNTP